MFVERDPELRLVAPAVHDADHAIELCREHRPDVVLMDIEFKAGMSGIEATRRIKEASPPTKVVIMTAHDDERMLVEAVEAGASGFLGKEKAADQVLATAKAAAEGEVLIDPQLLSRLLPQVAREREERREVTALFAQLSEREWEILRHVAQGERNDDIATALERALVATAADPAGTPRPPSCSAASTTRVETVVMSIISASALVTTALTLSPPLAGFAVNTMG